MPAPETAPPLLGAMRRIQSNGKELQTLRRVILADGAQFYQFAATPPEGHLWYFASAKSLTLSAHRSLPEVIRYDSAS